MSGAMEQIRSYRDVPAKRGMRVRVDGKAGTIRSASHSYINVLFDGATFPVPVHPTWRVVYLDEAGAVLLDTAERQREQREAVRAAQSEASCSWSSSTTRSATSRTARRAMADRTIVVDSVGRTKAQHIGAWEAHLALHTLGLWALVLPSPPRRFPRTVHRA